jgi:hypothetical protein
MSPPSTVGLMPDALIVMCSIHHPPAAVLNITLGGGMKAKYTAHDVPFRPKVVR